MNAWLAANGGELLAIIWDLIVQVGVPIAAAGIAAYVVIGQIRRADVYRKADRRAAGVGALTTYLVNASAMAVDLPKALAAERMRNNVPLVAAYGYLTGRDLVVARWAASQHGRIVELMDQWIDSPQPSPAGKVSPEQAEMSKIAAEAIQELLNWQNHVRPRSWFKAALKS